SELPAPFLRPEEEDLILLDRASYSVSEVVKSQLCLVCPARIEEKVGSIQRIVANEFIGRPVKCIGTGLGYEVNLGAAGGRHIRSVGVGLHLEFFDRINGRVNQDGASGAVVNVINAVHQPGVSVSRASTHRDINPCQ